MLLGIAAVCYEGLVRPGSWREQTNLGHRLGGDVFTEHSENTLQLFRKSIAELESHSDYLYSECDLQETADHHIVIFHDRDLRGLVPDTLYNRQTLDVEEIGHQKICELTLSQVKRLRLADGQSIPTLEETLATALELDLQKPLILEIKFFHSDRGRQAALDIASRFKDQADFEINFSAFRRNLSRSFDHPPTWLAKFQDKGFRIYQVYRPIAEDYDLCETW